jgi:hypothetical protein
MNKLTIFVLVILENIHIDYTCSTFYLSFVAKQLHIMSKANQKGQSRESGNIWYIRRTKQKHNTICVRHHYTQTKTQHNMC